MKVNNIVRFKKPLTQFETNARYVIKSIDIETCTCTIILINAIGFTVPLIVNCDRLELLNS